MDKFRKFWKSTFGRSSKHTRPVIVNVDDIFARTPERFPGSKRGIVSWKTLVSAPQTPTSALTVGMATCPPKHGFLCQHRHKQPEVYYITGGRGVMHVDGSEQDVHVGTVVYIPGDAEHGIRNNDPEEDLTWLYVFPTDGFADVEYRF